ncbi:hypothetical protein [Brevibacillus daliensis]|uniref:hypothetical protein n=1 Tax=Brevibacillus daliensis TaxID=2892995 RepID=UPI001E4F2BCB|nr:hypothetical protein [Brevibacillus daliensis]
MSNQVRNVFGAVYTARGYVSFYDSLLQNVEQLYLIKSPIGSISSTVLTILRDELRSQEKVLQVVHSPWNYTECDALILPEEKVAIMDARIYEAAVKPIDNLVPIIVDVLPEESSEQQAAVLREVDEELEKAYACYGKALVIHDDWERIYISNMDFNKANQVAEHICETIFASNLQKEAKVMECYFGAATPDGNVDHILSLTEDVKRYYIKGRPGSGKSTMLKKIAQSAQQNGYDTEIYHCALDPNSLDMVLVRETGVAFFDSTAPHEYDPVRPSDEIIDMYEIAIQTGTDEKYAEQLETIIEKYTVEVKQARGHLVRAKELRNTIVRKELTTLEQSIVIHGTRELLQKITG